MNFDEVLKNLQRDYIASLPAKISDIRERIKSGEPALLREAFHKLKGTGRTYGIPEISELAAMVEGICLNQPNEAGQAAKKAVTILQDISSARKSNNAFMLTNDSRYKEICRLR